jgi:dTDP-glucose pyrophosphorylase
MSESWRKAMIRPEAPIREVMVAIGESRIQTALVVDGTDRLLGTVTDGDIRRALLRGASDEDPASGVMNASPQTLPAGADARTALESLRKTTHRCIPRLDGQGRVVAVWHAADFALDEKSDNTVVVMAGGLGSRLSPLTRDVPKPLIEVGGKPILETILDNFRAFGFRDFFFSVNYLSEQIKSHFGDGSGWGVSIRYLEEREQLGTAGSLSLLPARPVHPLLVMNGDVLTKINFLQLLEFHRQQGSAATMCVREYDLQVPYGVVRPEGARIVSVDEKPVHRFFVNAGIYVLEPDALNCIPADSHFDMTSLFQHLIAQQKHTSAYPIREYWLDVGRHDDLERARNDFKRNG